jgi:hypothetical protein
VKSLYTIFFALFLVLGIVHPHVKAEDATVQDVPERRYSAFNAVQFAEADINVLAKIEPKIKLDYIRYISLHNIPKASRPIYKAIVDFVLNSLSPFYRAIVRTASLPSYEDPIVLRVNLIDYGINPKAWDDLAINGSGPVPLSDPYFHTRLEKVIEDFKEEEYTEKVKQQQGTDEFGRPRYVEVPTKKTRKVKSGERKEYTLSTAPWLAIEPDPTIRGSTMSNLVKLTNSTTGSPILRGDWFIVYATWAPAYYNLLGLQLRENPGQDEDAKKRPKVFLEKDFEYIFKFDEKVAVADIVAGIADTQIVALHNRILHRFNTVVGVTGGYYWRSQDTDTGTDAEDYMNDVTTFARPKIKAQEIIASGRNGLNFYALTDNKGRLLDVAAATIAQHGDQLPTKFPDKQVFSGRNCMLCHAIGQRDIQDKVRALTNGNIQLIIPTSVKDPGAGRRVIEAFSPNLQTIIKADNEKFNASLLAASGMSGKELGPVLETIIYDYFYQQLTLEKMAWEVGIDPVKLGIMLKDGKGLHYTLTSVLQTPPLLVSRLPWERDGHSALMQFVITYQPTK